MTKLIRKMVFTTLCSIPILASYQLLANEPFELGYRIFLIIITVIAIIFVMNKWMNEYL